MSTNTKKRQMMPPNRFGTTPSRWTSRYNFFVPSFFKDCIIAYNSFTGAFFTLNEADYHRCREILHSVEEDPLAFDAEDELTTKLLEHGFVVTNGNDESTLLTKRYHVDRDRKRGLCLTIAPTINCNFRCTYCFQEHPTERMTAENVTALKRYVENHLESGTSLDITWFGGEPLLAFDLMEELCTYFGELCETRKCMLSQSVITNGSLLDQSKIDTLASYQNVSFIQITLDGPPEVHDQRRIKVGNKSTFDTIVNNITLAAQKLPIAVRVNIDRSNYHRLNHLVDAIVERGLREKVNMYLGQVDSYTDVCKGVETIALTKEEFATIESQFQLHLLQKGFSLTTHLPAPKSGNLCIADHPGGGVFAPGNRVFHCWNEVAMSADAASGMLVEHEEELSMPEEKPLGESVLLTQTDEMKANQERWQAYDPFAHEMCRSCKVQPLCHGGCPWEARKNPAWSTGHCTTLKYNLADKLRLFHLQTAMNLTCKNQTVSDM